MSLSEAQKPGQEAEGIARIDLHCHSRFSAMTDEWMAELLGVQESYTDPETVYRNAKARGMTHVTLTDRDTIDGALRLADRSDFIVGEEVTAFFPSEALHVDVLVWGLDETQHGRIQNLRYDLLALVDYMEREGLAYGLPHPASFQLGGLRAEHFELLLLLFSLWETRDGHSDPEANALVADLVRRSPSLLPDLAAKHGRRAAGPLRGFGGSDDRSGLDAGSTFTQLRQDGDLLAALRGNETEALGEHGSTPKTAHTAVSLFAGTAGAGGRVATWGIRRVQRSPLLWELLRLPAGRKLAGRALALAAFGGRHLGASASWQMSTLREVATEFSSGEMLAADRHGRLAAAAETAWQQAVGVNLRLLRERLEDGGRRPDEEIKEIGQAQLLLAPYLSAAAYRTRQRRHAERLGRLLSASGLLPPRPETHAPRVAVFTDTYREVNGVATVLQALAAHAAHQGWPFTLVDCGERRESAPGHETFVPLETLSWKVYSEFPMHIAPVLELLRWCEGQRLDIIHAATPGPVGLAALLIAKALDLPLLATYHTDLPRLGYFLTRDHSAEELLWSYVRWFYGHCRVVFCPSRLIRDDLADHGVRSRFAPFEQAVDGDRFSPARRDEALHRTLGGDGKVILWVGRVSAEKGLDLLAAAYRDLLARRDDARLVLVGDGPYRTELSSRLPEATFLGYRAGDELAAIYASADLFVFPGLADTFGQVVLEAAASGLPAVVSAGVAVDEVAVRDETALMVAPGDVKGFRAAIEKLLDDDERRQSMGAAARRKALDRSWAATFEGVSSVYHQMLS